MDRNHGACVIYHFCLGFSCLFPVKNLCPIAKDRQINAVKSSEGSFISPAFHSEGAQV